MEEAAADIRFDNCSELGAHRLAERIAIYWRSRGYDKIRVAVRQAESVTKHNNPQSDCYAVASNIGPDGFPPR